MFRNNQQKKITTKDIPVDLVDPTQEETKERKLETQESQLTLSSFIRADEEEAFDRTVHIRRKEEDKPPSFLQKAQVIQVLNSVEGYQEKSEGKAEKRSMKDSGTNSSNAQTDQTSPSNETAKNASKKKRKKKQNNSKRSMAEEVITLERQIVSIKPPHVDSILENLIPKVESLGKDELPSPKSLGADISDEFFLYESQLYHAYMRGDMSKYQISRRYVQGAQDLKGFLEDTFLKNKEKNGDPDATAQTLEEEFNKWQRKVNRRIHVGTEQRIAEVYGSDTNFADETPQRELIITGKQKREKDASLTRNKKPKESTTPPKPISNSERAPWRF